MQPLWLVHKTPLSPKNYPIFYRAAIQRLRDDWDYDEEECEKMGMSFLQKVARSGCYRKSDYAVDRMMEARHW